MKKDRRHDESVERMRDLVTQKDWRQTPLGPMDDWPSELRVAVDIMLEAEEAIGIYWGKDLILLYNDLAREQIGAKHPEALGRPAHEVFPEAWETLGSIHEQVMAGDGPVRVEEKYLPLQRNGELEDLWWNSSFNPITLADGSVGGVLNISVEITARKQTELKHEQFLLKLSDAIRPLSDPVEIQKKAAHVIGEYLKVDRAHYREVYVDKNTNLVYADYHHPDITSLAGKHQLNDFGPYIHDNFLAGDTIVIDDFSMIEGLSDEERAMYQKTNITAWVGVPLVKEGRLRAYFVVNQAKPRKWSALEVQMIEETAERTWAAVEQARAERDLHESEERLDVAVTNSPLTVWQMDTELRYTWIKHPHQEFKVADVLGKRDDELLLPDAAETVMTPKRRAMETGETVREEVTYNLPTGEEVSFDLTTAPLRDERGEITGVTCAAFDITERKEQEKRDQFLLELSDALQTLSDAAESQQVATKMVGEHLDVANANYARIEIDQGIEYYNVLYSYSAPGRNSFDGRYRLADFSSVTNELHRGQTMTVPDIATDDRLEEEDKVSYAAADVAAFIMSPLVKDGHLKAIFTVYDQQPRDWSAAEIVLVEEVAERTWATAERARAEEALRESEEQLQMAQDTAQLGYWELNTDTKDFSCSPICKAHFGRAPDDSLTYENIIESIHPDDWNTKKQIMQHALATGEGYKLEYRIQWPDGTRRWIYTRAQVSGKTQLLGVTLDISDRKKIEEELQQRTRALQTNRMKLRSLVNELSRAEENQRFILAGELHDNLGQILDFCKLKFDLLMKNNTSNIPPTVHEIRDLIEKAIHSTRRLVNDLKPTPTEEKEDLDSALRWVAGKMEKYGLIVTINNGVEHKGVDQRSLDTLVQAVQELLFNVVKHAETNQAWLTVSQLNKFLQIKVRDEGKGFDLKHHKESTGQDGFGLFNVRQRIDLLGGTVNIKSEPGTGTTAIVQIPTNNTDIPDQTPQTSQSLKSIRNNSTVPSSNLSLISVLVVDDHQMMREGIAGIINAENDMLVINEVSTGEEAISMVDKVNPDVVIMDINLPGMNGITATKMIKANYPSTKVIGISFLNDQELISNIFNAGASDFISKDETLQTICQAIREAVS